MRVFFDTEDNSKELFAAARARGQRNLARVGFRKEILQAGAITASGDSWHSRGPKSGERLLEWLLKIGASKVYALNLQYDLGNLFSESLDALDVTLVGGRMIKARWRGLEFLDVFNL